MKIKFGALVVDGSGKLGGHVVANNKGGKYMRTKVTPTNPQSVAQMNVRGIFASISSGWSTLAEAGRKSFNDFVSAYAKTDIFGDLRNPSGKALYQQLNQNLILTGQSTISTCVSPEEVPFANLSQVEASIAGASLEATIDGTTSSSKLLFFATPALSQGTTFVKNKLRSIGYEDGVDADVVDIKALYNAKFGAFTLGQNFYVGVKVINSNGQASPLEVRKVLVTA